jgi:hypothetical protein
MGINKEDIIINNNKSFLNIKNTLLKETRLVKK